MSYTHDEMRARNWHNEHSWTDSKKIKKEIGIQHESDVGWN